MFSVVVSRDRDSLEKVTCLGQSLSGWTIKSGLSELGSSVKPVEVGVRVKVVIMAKLLFNLSQSVLSTPSAFRVRMPYKHCFKRFSRKVLIQRNCEYRLLVASTMEDLFRVVKRSPIPQPHTPGLRRGYSWSSARLCSRLRIRLHPHWNISLLQSLCWALGQTEVSSNF